jgi:hypothetical protein
MFTDAATLRRLVLVAKEGHEEVKVGRMIWWWL